MYDVIKNFQSIKALINNSNVNIIAISKTFPIETIKPLIVTMAYIRKHRNKWQSIIRIQGHPHLAKSFISKVDAKRWAIETEIKIRREDAGIARIYFPNFTDLAQKYINEVSIHKIRKLFEASKNDGIIPLYEDDERTLLNYIKKELDEFKGLTNEICNLIISNSKVDRRFVQNEITKIKSFFNDKIIKKESLQNLLNLKKESDFDEIRDSVITGEKVKHKHI